MQEVIDYWNKQHSLYTMEYERRSYYKDGHDNDLWIVRIKKDNTIIKEYKGTDFITVYNKIKGEPI